VPRPAANRFAQADNRHKGWSNADAGSSNLRRVSYSLASLRPCSRTDSLATIPTAKCRALTAEAVDQRVEVPSALKFDSYSGSQLVGEGEGLALASSLSTEKTAPPLPAPQGNVVYVSNDAQLQAAMGNIASDMTVVLAPGEYLLSRSLYIKGVNNFTLRGATDNPRDVILTGPGMTNSQYGQVPYGVWVGDASNAMIANMTIRDFYFHPLIFNANAENPRVYNMRLVDAGEQFLKSNPDGRGGGNDRGVVEYSTFEYTTTARSYYLGAIDVHTGDSWVIRDNVFRNIRPPAGVFGGTTIRMWNYSSNTLIERNAFFNCQYGVALGLDPSRPSDHTGGMVRNNFFHRSSSQDGDVAIVINHSPGAQVLHNTILLNGTYKNAIEYRFSDTTGTVIKNNLTDAAIQSRDGATGTIAGNLTTAVAPWFVNASHGRFSLDGIGDACH
jgi:hypothetical protein